MNYLTSNELALRSFEDVSQVIESLVNNGYVVMVSREENLWIINYEWTNNESDRNDIVFILREKVEDQLSSYKDTL